MTLKDDERIIMVNSYISRGDRALNDAKNVREISPGLSARSAYETAYFATLALFVSYGLEVPRTHRGVNNRLYEEFVREREEIPADIASYLGELETDRNIAQYHPVEEISAEDAKENIEKAVKFYDVVNTLIAKQVERLEPQKTHHKMPEEISEEEIKKLNLIDGEAKIYVKPIDLVNYRGPILHCDKSKGFSVQQTGKVSLVVHEHKALIRVPEKGENLQINYKRGQTAEVKTLAILKCQEQERNS